MVEYKLHYFNFRGRAEIARLIFAAAGQKYEDVRFEREKWPKIQPTTPLGKVPYLEIHDGGKVFQLGQSITIARYLARKFNLAGKGDEEQAEAEMFGDQITDLLNELLKVRFEQDATKKADLSKKLFEETFPNSFKIFDERIAKSGSGFLVSSGLTWADLYLVNILEWFGDKKEATLGNFQNIKALDDKVRNHPKIAEWLAKRPKTDM